ncbi:FtsW/RodA/SpoVE family cell cycle protein [Companilactobacillus alimentarius]|uniref:FtsW/RodA/SpoVE family cell cycle protein n=1 Tax=Companilactobacillus alimentarius TaxID=1602 RepID=UPI0006EF0DE9|nr:FtsW/RodA/SpoVE family cell cycle protein [Companilactobacillus alimentarius]KRK75124.1 cell division membrane protein [Companilactobacillus alimentarius DSM 20249]GEO44101.1 cell division protein FtsW [Companilactobacillus alimentarius]
MKKLKKIDLWIVIPYILLLGIGIVMVYSASFYNTLMAGGKTDQYLIKQAVFAGVGLFLCYFCFILKAKFFRKRVAIKYALLFTILSLASLPILGKIFPSLRVNGAVAWIPMGPFGNYQPLELAKLVLILYLAFVLTSKQERLLSYQNWKEVGFEVLPPILVVGMIVFLLLIQPDFGGAIVISLITWVLLGASTIPGKYIVRLSTALAAFLGLVIFMILKLAPSIITSHYQYKRILAMQHPFKWEQQAGAQLVNSFYAISNGGIFGVGLGNGIQKRGYLPEPHTDFILAVISEELGLVGDVVVLGLLAIIIFRIILIGIRAKKNYNALVCYGVATMLLTQVILNVGGLLSLIPLTGVTLPFISYGGSSMLILSIALGIVLNLDATTKFERTG